MVDFKANQTIERNRTPLLNRSSIKREDYFEKIDKLFDTTKCIVIQASSGLTEAEIQRMIKEAEANAVADKERKEFIEEKNKADSLVYTTEKTLKEHGESLTDEDKKAIEAASSDLKKAMETDNIADIKQKIVKLQEVSVKLGEAVYQASQNAGAEGSAEPNNTGSSSNSENVVDAEYEEVDDSKKKSA
jgi:molecular chaperone DnaK